MLLSILLPPLSPSLLPVRRMSGREIAVHEEDGGARLLFTVRDSVRFTSVLTGDHHDVSHLEAPELVNEALLRWMSKVLPHKKRQVGS